MVALLAALMINLGFAEALVAFCVSAVLLLGGVILQVILARYQRAEFLNDAAGEALRLNPSIEEKYLTDKTE